MPGTRTLFEPPPDLTAIRSRIFEGKEEVKFAPGEFDQYWPFFNNIYTRTGNPYTRKNGQTTTHFRCLLHNTKPKLTKGLDLHDRIRKTPSRKPIGCPKTVRKISYA